MANINLLNIIYKLKPIFLLIFLVSLLLLILVPELHTRIMFIDETFLFRAAYIQFYIKDIHPQLVTPISFTIGSLLSWTENYKLIFLGTRYFDLVALILAITYVPKKVFNSWWAPAVFLIALLLHPSAIYFLTQARYDTSIFILSFLFLGLLAEKREFGYRSILISALLITSTLKGFYYFIPIILLFLANFFYLQPGRSKEIIFYFLKLSVVVSVFVFVFSSFGVLPQFFDTYRDQWWQIVGWTTDIETLKFNLYSHFRSGPLFYYLVLVSLILVLSKKLVLPFRKEITLYLGFVFFFSWIYFLKHARPYVFMTTPADFVGALLISLFLLKVSSFIQKKLLLVSSVIVVLLLQLYNNPLFFYLYMSEPKPGFTTKEALNFPEKARALLTSNHKVFDPSGLLYYANPCSSEWYLDSPHRDQMAKKRWLLDLNLENCTHAIISVEKIFFDFNLSYGFGKNFEILAYPLAIKRTF